MTRVRQPISPEYRVEVRAGNKLVGKLDNIWDKTTAQELFASIKTSFPDSMLKMSVTSGDWFEATSAEIARIDDINAALTLAEIFEVGLTRIDWTLSKYDSSGITGYARSRDVVAEYAKLLDADIAEEPQGERTSYRVKGVFRDVTVSVYCTVKDKQPELAKQVEAVA